MKLDTENKPHFMNEPHVTIARKLKPWQYEQGCLEFSHHHFTGKFIADKMMLLRKRAGEYKFSPMEIFFIFTTTVNELLLMIYILKIRSLRLSMRFWMHNSIMAVQLKFIAAIFIDTCIFNFLSIHF